MKYAVTSDEMKRYDRNTSERFGVKPEILMERASLCVADEIEKYISSKNAADCPKFFVWDHVKR